MKRDAGFIPDSHAPAWMFLAGARYSLGYGKLMVGGLGSAIHFEPQAFIHAGVHAYDGDVGPSSDLGLGLLVFLMPKMFTTHRRRDRLRARGPLGHGRSASGERCRRSPSGERCEALEAQAGERARARARDDGRVRSRRDRASSGPVVGAGAPVAETRDELLVATGDAVWRGDLDGRARDA